MYQKVMHKRGDSFLRTGTVLINGKPTDITGWAIASQVRFGTKLVETLQVTVTDAEKGEYRLASPGTTERWPLGALAFDIKYTTDTGQVIRTDTVAIDCNREVTA